VGPERGAVGVSGWVRCRFLPFLDEEALALELQLGVGAARGGGWVLVTEEVLGGHREGFEPAGA